jgi:hypothetical protein
VFEQRKTPIIVFSTLWEISNSFKPVFYLYCCKSTINFYMKRTKNILLQSFAVMLLVFVTGQNAFAQPAGGLNFDGTNDYVAAPDDPSLTATTAFTLSAWVKWEPGPSNLACIISQPRSASGTGINLQINQSNGAFVLAFIGNGVNSAFSSPSNLIQANVWTHLAGTFDNTTVNLYQDGALVSSVNTNPGTVLPTTEPLLIGVEGLSGTISSRRLKGTLDEVSYWGIARTGTDIQADMNCGLSGNETGLLAYYKFDNANATPGGNNPGETSLADFSANSNTGTLNNFALAGPTSNWVNSAPSCNQVAVPTLGQWGLILLALTFLCMGAIVLQRRSKRPSIA